MPDFTVQRYGTDTSGRPILMTAYMRDWWFYVTLDLGFEPTIVQGAFMAQVGGGAAASAGYHDLGGCLDLRVWDLTDEQVKRTIRTLRRFGAGAWLRDQAHGGFDPHIHLVLGTDSPLASGAAWQWGEYRNDRDGLASRGRDYHWRPSPLVTTPPEDEMPSTEEIAAQVVDRLRKEPFNVVGGESIPFDRMISQIHNRVGTGRDRLGRALAKLDREAKANKAVAEAVAEIRKALEESDGSPRG